MRLPSSEVTSELRMELPGRRAVAAATIGNALEWFDWSSYSSFAGIFSKQIFGSSDTALLSAFAVFGVGFLMRPLGGFLIGSVSDRRGRMTALVLAISMMATGSLLIGVVPTYAQAGVWSAVLLTLGRLIQGLSVGGDYGASPVYLSEVAPAERRGLVSSLHYVSLALGILVASVLGWVLSSTLPEADLAAWGWRIPFLLGAVLGLWGLYLRRSVPESPTFVRMQESSTFLDRRPPWSERVRPILRVIGMTALASTIFWTLTSYLPGSATVNHVSTTGVFAASSGAMLLFLLLQPVMGALSDRIGRKPLLIGYAAVFAALAYPLLAMLRMSTGLVLFLSMVFGLGVFSAFSSISAAFYAESFPAATRASGIGTAHNVSSALFGGTAPYLLELLTRDGRQWWFAIWVVFIAVVGLVLFTRLREMRGQELP